MDKKLNKMLISGQAVRFLYMMLLETCRIHSSGEQLYRHLSTHTDLGLGGDISVEQKEMVHI